MKVPRLPKLAPYPSQNHLTTNPDAEPKASKICHNPPLHKYRPGGEIGRLRGLKIPRRKACRFESGPGHQSKAASSRNLRLFSWAPHCLACPQSIPALHRSFQLRSICRRSRLVGRPCSMLSAGSRAKRFCSAAFWRAAMLSGVSV